jgi:hypothetical protein
MCLYPRLHRNKKYTKTIKNGGVIPPINDLRVLYVPIKCGNCIECRNAKKREWQIRMQEEIKTSTNGKFVTLTLNNQSIKEITAIIHNEIWQKINKIKNTTIINEANEQQTINKQKKEKEIILLKEKLYGYGLDNQIATKATRLFLERWRKKHKKSVKHWLVTELGHNGTENIHLHGIIWTTENMNEITKQWKYGYVYPRNEEERKENYVNAKTINYIIKYISKVDEKHREYKSIILNSAGIGKNYTKTHNSKNNKYKEKNTNETYRTENGQKIALPIYYRNEIYTEEEREKLWIEKLDKNERWIMGERIDITESEEEYYKTLEYYRKKNIELGYSDNSKNWERIEYENNRRIIMQKKRTT